MAIFCTKADGDNNGKFISFKHDLCFAGIFPGTKYNADTLYLTTLFPKGFTVPK